MNIAIGIIGVALILFGGFVNFAAGMASIPDEKLGKRGCFTAVFGLILLIGAFFL